MPQTPAFRAPIGTKDVFYPESLRWEKLVSTFAALVERANYGLVISPMFEDIGVFVRGMGESTDVVSKEMYEFVDKGDRRLALRPEGTASLVRAYVQHRPPSVWKAWYVTPAFRYERPQAGRFRQHHQLGIEAIGSGDPDLDVEVVALAAQVYDALGLASVGLRLGSMGDETCRPPYVEALRQYLAGHVDQLCPEHQRRWQLNPLRVLDCKKPECQGVTEDAPYLLDGLCDPCSRHLDRVKEGLQALGVGYELDPRLVRGFDYYTRTTFEFEPSSLTAAHNAVGGGGRYDGLVEALGGRPTPGIGFSMGIERILMACDAEGVFPTASPALDAFVIDMTGGRVARDLTAELRSAGLRADRTFDARSPRAQLKAADRAGAKVALIVGPEEAAAGTVTLRNLRTHHEEVVERVAVVKAVNGIVS